MFYKNDLRNVDHIKVLEKPTGCTEKKKAKRGFPPLFQTTAKKAKLFNNIFALVWTPVEIAFKLLFYIRPTPE